MPEYQLHVALALAVALAGSLGTHLLSGSSKSKDALPTFSEGQEGLARDPFDVTKPEDFVDGTPLNEGAFWTKVRPLARPPPPFAQVVTSCSRCV